MFALRAAISVLDKPFSWTIPRSTKTRPLARLLLQLSEILERGAHRMVALGGLRAQKMADGSALRFVIRARRMRLQLPASARRCESMLLCAWRVLESRPMVIQSVGQPRWCLVTTAARGGLDASVEHLHSPHRCRGELRAAVRRLPELNHDHAPAFRFSR